MTNRTKRQDWKRMFAIFVLSSLILSILFVIVMLFIAPTKNTTSDFIRTKSDYTLMLIQCLLGVAAMFLPSIIERKWNFDIPNTMEVLYVVFLYCAIFLGEVRNFYHLIPYWDTILHTFSGAMLGALGFSVVSLMNDTEKWHLNLSPAFVAFFAFCFSITLGVFWEIYEFSFDGLLGLNMQKFALEDGTLLIGRAALSDSMKDLIVDGVGALAISIIGFISLKYKKGWLEAFAIRSNKN